MIIPQDTIFQNESSSPINIVDALRSNVKSTIEKANDQIIIYGLHLLLSWRDPHMIIGKMGRTQGAKTVNNHATNDRIRISILLVLLN